MRQLQVDDSSGTEHRLHSGVQDFTGPDTDLWPLPPDIPAGKFDVAVTDHSCPPQLRTRVTSQEVPIVSPEWLIQSLICGERMDFQRGWEGSSSPCSSSS